MVRDGVLARTASPRLPIALAWLLVLGTAPCADAARWRRGEPGQAVDGVRIEIVGLPESRTTADPVVIRFRVTNSGRRPVHFEGLPFPSQGRRGPTWYGRATLAPFPGLTGPTGDLLRARLIPPYDPGGSVVLASGQTHEGAIDLTHIYVLADPGTYHVYMHLRTHVRSFWTKKMKAGPWVFSKRHTFSLADAPMESRVARGVQQVASTKWQVRNTGAIVLGETKSPKAVPALARAIDDENARVRAYAAMALGRIGGKEAVAELTRRLTGPEGGVRREPVLGLGYARDPAAVPSLIEAFSRNDARRVRGLVIWALGEIGDKRASDMLLREFANPKSDVRRDAAAALGKIGDERAVSPLVEELDKACGRKRHTLSGASLECAVIGALGDIGSRHTVRAIAGVLDQPNVPMRKAAAKALGQIGGQAAVFALAHVCHLLT